MFEKAVKAFLKAKVCVGRAAACGALIGAPQIQRDRESPINSPGVGCWPWDAWIMALKIDTLEKVRQPEGLLVPGRNVWMLIPLTAP